MSFRSLSRNAWTAGVFAAVAPAFAQTCPVPALLSANVTQAFDTCQGDSGLAFVCGLFPLAGPATVVRLELPYPVGEISVQSMDAGFQPSAFLLQARCRGDVPCSAVAGTGPGSTGAINLSAIDSGSYFLVVAAADFAEGAGCGHVAVTANISTEQEVLERDGVFRSGSAQVWRPPQDDAP